MVYKESYNVFKHLKINKVGLFENKRDKCV